MYSLPVSIMYLPDWYVQAVGRTKIESEEGTDVSKLNPSDMDALINANEAFFCYLYGGTGLNQTLIKENSLNIIDVFSVYGPGVKTIFSNTGSSFYDLSVNLIESIYGVNSKENGIEDKGTRLQLLCRAFEDVKIFKNKDGKIFVYTDKSSDKYYDRTNLLKEVLTNISAIGGYKSIVQTELFKKFLSSSIKDEDLKHTFLHKVG